MLNSFFYLLSILVLPIIIFGQNQSSLEINDKGYYELPGLSVMVFDDFYPGGHQGGLTVVQFGSRILANGDVRLDPTPGQWSPMPKMGNKKVDKEKGIISVELWYPDSSRDNKGFNPIDYPDLKFKYKVKTESVGQSIKVCVDLEKPLPEEWANKVGFNLELFPGEYFGEHYLMDDQSGILPRQVNGPMKLDQDGEYQITPLAVGKELVIAPGNKKKKIKIVSNTTSIQLLDGRALYENGWYVARSVIPSGAVKNAVEWIITPTIDTNWRYKPVVQISQIGYHPKQEKFAVVELDKLTDEFESIQIIKIDKSSQRVIKADENPKLWGNFLRYKYLRFDFSEISEEGIYKLKYGDVESNEFEIKTDIFSRHVWHPTLEYFLPIQMCHMRVEERYRVWHDLCHMDDAKMAPLNTNFFDGYKQGPSTLTKYKSGDHVPGLNIGGWHDAADYDVQIHSQSTTVYRLLLAYEFFQDDYDQTLIDQENRFVDIRHPDGKPDILQQVEHGLLSIVGGYEALGRFYRGMQEATRHLYVMNSFPNNLKYKEGEVDPVLHKSQPDDDRRVFTHINSQKDLLAAQVLASAYRVLKDYNPELSEKCLIIAEEVYNEYYSTDVKNSLNTAAELYLSTSKKEYAEYILEHQDTIANNIINYGIVLGRIVKMIDNEEFTQKIEKAVKETYQKISKEQEENPYGVPYKPYIWGAGWGIQSAGVTQLLIHMGFPDIFPSNYAFNALNFVLGCHPGTNTASFASGVGVNSLEVAYGFNRADWSYIPGGVASGTALIRPDLPELKTWPFFWQQAEYVMNGGATNFMLLALAADHLFNKKESGAQSMIDADDHGYLRIDKNKRYFAFDDGTSFIPIGLNEYKLLRLDKKQINSIMTNYADHGINLLRIWVDLHVQEFEYPVGVFNQSRLNKLDFVIKRAEELGIYLNLCFFDENGVKKDFAWNMHPYNNINGGPAENKFDMYDTTDTDSWNALKNRYRKIIKRYENSRSIVMWDIINDSEKHKSWKEGMYDYVKSQDSNNRIITFQYNTGKNPGGELDCGSVRVYNYNPEGNNPELMAKVLDERIREAMKGGDPVYVGEGRMEYTEEKYNTERGFLHLMWMPIASGAAGNTLWWAEGTKKWPSLSDQELNLMLNYSRFCNTIDWKNFNSKNVNNEVKVSLDSIVPFACSDEEEMLVYLMNDDSQKQFNEINTTVTIDNGLQDQAYTVDWIDIRTGETVMKQSVEQVPFTVKVPTFNDGIFAHILKANNQ